MIGAVVSDKYTFATLRSHVSLWIVVGAFRGMLVEDALAKPNHGLAECSATHSFPCREAVGASDKRVEEQRRVLHDPCDHWMADGDLHVDPGFEA